MQEIAIHFVKETGEISNLKLIEDTFKIIKFLESESHYP
jgi:hypothetical protein